MKIASGKYLENPTDLAVEVSEVFEKKPTRKEVADFMCDKFGFEKDAYASNDFVDTLDSVMNELGFLYDEEIESSKKAIKSASYTLRGDKLKVGDYVYVKSEDEWGTITNLRNNMVDVYLDNEETIDVFADDCWLPDPFEGKHPYVDGLIGQSDDGRFKIFKNKYSGTYELAVDGRVDREVDMSNPTVESVLDKWANLFDIKMKPEYLNSALSRDEILEQIEFYKQQVEDTKNLLNGEYADIGRNRRKLLERRLEDFKDGLARLNEMLEEKEVNSARTPEPLDKEAAHELALYAENERDLYFGAIAAVIKNLKRKSEKGIYDAEKAVDAWMYVADEAAKKYSKEFGGSFNKATRRAAAEELKDFYADEFEGDNVIESSIQIKPIKSNIESIKDIVENSEVNDYIFEWIQYGDEDNPMTQLAKKVENEPENKELLMEFLAKHAKWADESDLTSEYRTCTELLEKLKKED